ncbi:cilia- and flagella-associated protein 251 [Ixodes scapularis]|uniref:cilia- and flagella-associated protein 251 n=1 Tax=Ixodes scapularis TaxID=6945 RepID=UPI001C395085|nr:cilia- and flagella-associated protein 251 [Ixodes scapularis]
MKIQAFPTIAVVAALLSLVCGAPASTESNERDERTVEPEAEDRSCKKRDADAQKAFKNGETVEHCNYFCKPYKDGYSYDEKKYPVGTKCMYAGKVSKCTEEGCRYPKDSADDDENGTEKPGKVPNEEEEKENEKKEEEEEKEEKNEEEEKNDEKNEETDEGETQGDEGKGEGKEEGEPTGDEDENEGNVSET